MNLMVMVGSLTSPQIDHVLNSQIIGRIGCCVKDKIYIVPVSYVYNDGYIYAHSREGLKVKIMRKNPNVCFQVDSMDNMTNWRSVILWGKYEELINDDARNHGMKILSDRLIPFLTSESVRITTSSAYPEIIEKQTKAVVYRINILEKTGRFEKNPFR